MIKRSMILVIAISFVLGVLSASLAVPKIEEIKASINYDIKMTLNGQPFQPMDNGKNLRPITYNGRTYLPVRNLCDALNIPVEWNGETQTIILGEKTDKIKVTSDDFYSMFGSEITSDKEILDIGNKQYEYGIYTEKDQYDHIFELSTNKKFSKFGTDISLVSGSFDEAVIEFYNEKYGGELLKTITVKKGDLVTVEFDIAGINKIAVRIKNISSGADEFKLIFGEPYFK